MKILRSSLLNIWKSVKKNDDKRMALQTPTPGIDCVSLPYSGDGHPMHALNIYYPADTEGLLPVIIDIHGGGWMYGDKDLNRFVCRYWASKGFAVMAMSYRLFPEVTLQGMVQDIFSAMHWLKGHGAEHHCDMSRVCITGDSAGGHLAALALCIDASPELQAVYGVTGTGLGFKAGAITHGCCNAHTEEIALAAMKIRPLVKLLRREVDAMMYGENVEASSWWGKAAFQETAPFVEAAGRALPPLMLVSSEADYLHPQTLEMARYLEARGAAYTLRFATKAEHPELGHVYNISYPEWPESIATNDAIIGFFTSQIA
jgi:acetyl esterase/lipase